MKNLKKLFVAAIMLVVALTAVVSSTYAWFTIQNQADVKEIEMQIGTAGNDLQVATTIDGPYNYSITLGDINGLLVPVTYDNQENGFYKLDYNDETGNYDYVLTGATDVFAPGDTFTVGSEDKGYLEYDLFFRSATAGNVVKLDTTVSQILSTNAYAKGAARVMFVTYAENNETVAAFQVWESDPNTASTYGTGTYFAANQPYVVYGSMEEFLDLPVGEGTAYTLDKTWLGTREYATIDGDADDITIKILGAANTPARVTVRIWLEGWDGDAFNLASDGTNPLTAYLKFLGNE